MSVPAADVSHPDVPDSPFARFRDLATAALCLATVALIARNLGGWWPTTWGWAALALLFVAAAALILQPTVALGRLDLAMLGSLGALTAWTGLSALWSESPPQTILELERAAMYLGGVLALLLVARRRSVGAALGGLLAADVAICLYALATRLVPDRLDRPGASVGFRLAGVFGYPNALGIIAVLGLLLALGFCADARPARIRALAGAATVPLALALYLANSRGSWISLAAGLAAAVALTPRRLQLARALAPLLVVGAVVIWLASRSRPVTLWDDPLAAAHDGHLLVAASVLLAVAVALVAARPTRATIGVAAAVAVLAIAVAPSSPARVVLALGAQGGPIAVPGAPLPGTTPGDRLFSATSNSRTEYWRVAAADFRRHPVAGSGAGTFVREWYRERRIETGVQDAHSLYLETLAELGVVGLALLLAVLAVPPIAATRVRGEPLVVGAFGAFTAFAVHAAVDWDWELPAVTFAGLLCGCVLVVAARPEPVPLLPGSRLRLLAVGFVLVLGAFSFVGLVGNRAQAAGLAAAARRDWPTTATEAQRARTWAPWSAEALVLAADAAGAQGEVRQARSLLRRAVRKDAHDFRLWSRLAAVTVGEERRLALRRAAQLNPLG